MGMLSCTSQQDKFIVKGQFTGLQDAELYFWTPDGGHGKIDTITVREGKFAYESPQEKEGWYTLMFQNMSEQVLFAEPGLSVEVSADATHLREMKIEGGEANKLMSQFRMELGQETQTAIIAQKAASFIQSHPESIVSIYLLQKYFVQQGSSDLKQTSKLVELLLKAQPQNTQLLVIKNILAAYDKVNVGQKAPDFHIKDIKGNQRTLENYKDSTLLLCFWANWESGSREDIRPLKDISREWKDKVSILTVSLDLMKVSWRTFIRIDSLPGRHTCDLHAWDSPIVKDYGITELPTYVLIDKNQKIIARENELKKIHERLK